MSVLAAAERLREACAKLDVPVAHVYDPLQYAWAAHERYCHAYGNGPKRAVLVGMNPGPWGMGQTGVPFGDVQIVRDWMGITADVGRPPKPHPKRPVTGFATTRREPSGSRLYGWAQERFGTAAAFFSEFYVVNYCPLLFFDEDGKNLTPPQIGARAMRPVDDACDTHLADVLRALGPQYVIGVGQYAEERAAAVVAQHRLAMKVGRVLHPSPASPAANQGWARQAEAQLRELGVLPTQTRSARSVPP